LLFGRSVMFLFIPAKMTPFARSTTPIRLRVVDRSETQLGSQVRTEFLEFGAVKLLAVVHGDFVRHTEAAHDVLPEELLYCGRSNAQQWLRFNPFGEVFDRHYSVGVIPGCRR
jgi:hypothetical protein